MKIIIVGAGISGLSTYLHLLKHLSEPTTHTIVIYESHKPRSSPGFSGTATPSPAFESLSQSTQLVGGGLGIAPNGMRVLLTLDKNLHDAVVAQGFRVENFVFKGANGWTLGTQRTGDGKVREESEEEEFCVASSRHGLWETMFKHVIQFGGEEAVKYRKVVRVESNFDRDWSIVKFEDGGEDAADLVIGADGVKSVCRAALFGTEEEYAPKYLGQSGVGGFLALPIPASIATTKAMVFTFGPNGFFGYSSSGPTPPDLMWWSTFETSTVPSTKDIDASEIKKALVERHKKWKDPVLHDIVRKAEVQSIYPTWTIPELPHWGKRGIVLVGDSAHAMDPTTGQGASQGLEDSKTLAITIAECLKREKKLRGCEADERYAMKLAVEIYHEVRSPRVAEIVERGKKIAGKKSNVGVVLEYVTYFFLWLINTFPYIGKLMIGDVHRSLYTWSAEDEIHKTLGMVDDSY